MTSASQPREFTVEAEYTIGENETCLTALIDQVKTRPYGVLFTRPANFEWVNVTAQEFLDEVFAVAKGIIATGVEQGDRVALLADTRYEWSVLDYAIWAAGAATVPIYDSCPRCSGSSRTPVRPWRSPRPPITPT